MRTRISRAMWRQGYVNAFICGTALFAAWWILASLISLASGLRFYQSLPMSHGGLLIVIIAGFTATWIYGLRSRGRLLLDLGPMRVWYLFLLAAGFCVYAGIVAFTEDAPPVSLWRPFGVFTKPWTWLSIGAFNLVMATGRLQIRENGIWTYCDLLRWSKLVSYRWADDSTLMVKSKRGILWNGALPVPLKHKQAVEQFLLAHRPTQATA